MCEVIKAGERKNESGVTLGWRGARTPKERGGAVSVYRSPALLCPNVKQLNPNLRRSK